MRTNIRLGDDKWNAAKWQAGNKSRLGNEVKIQESFRLWHSVELLRSASNQSLSAEHY